VLGGGARLKTCRLLAVSRAGSVCGLAALLVVVGSKGLQTAVAEGDTRTISLHHVHTDESITITFKRDGRYDEAALEKLNWFLRDWRRQQETRMDPHLIDLIWEVQREAGSTEPVTVVCGYRSPETNAMLRRRSKGVARFSQHMLGHAMDFYIPGVPLEQLRVIGLRLQRGGVGFYPTSGSPFVHIDTGSVRHWPRMTHEQLARVFPDGRTVHIPSDGRPLAGYALALADVRGRGSSPSEMSIEAARNAGVDVSAAGIEPHKSNPFLKLLGLAKNEDEEEGDASAAATPNEPAAAPAEPLRARAKAAVVAAIEHAESKIAAEKAKIAQVAAKAHVITRAEAAPLPAATQPASAATPVAAATPNPKDVIAARGYWQGSPDSVTQPAAAKAVAAVARPRDVEVATADTNATGTLSPSSAGDDHVPPELALSYAEQSEREASRALPITAAASSEALAVQNLSPAGPGDKDTTIAVKRVGSRPASAILTATSKVATAIAAKIRQDDPWLRAVVLSPSVHRFLTTMALGARELRSLAALMVKPASSVMMTFSADPQLGLTHDRFSGGAVVFVPTVTYPTHTAALP